MCGKGEERSTQGRHTHAHTQTDVHCSSLSAAAIVNILHHLPLSLPTIPPPPSLFFPNFPATISLSISQCRISTLASILSVHCRNLFGDAHRYTIRLFLVILRHVAIFLAYFNFKSLLFESNTYTCVSEKCTRARVREHKGEEVCACASVCKCV